MSTITISLPDDDLAFLRTYAQERGITLDAVLTRQTQILRQHLQAPLHPDVVAAAGSITAPPDDERDYRQHLEGKYGPE